MSTEQPVPSGNPPKFDPDAPHHRRPRLRPVRGFPVQGQTPDGKQVQMLGLADARQISDKMVVTTPAAQVILPLLDGSRGIDEIVSQVGRGLTADILQQLVAQLDDAALLEGPIFDALQTKLRADFDSVETLPPASTAAFADSLVMQSHGKDATDEQKAENGPRRLKETFDTWMANALQKAENPAFDELPKAIVAPHLDYARGWPNYAGVYGRLRVCDRPDRVVILGTNHFGTGTGVVGCDKGYQTPLGVCAADADLIRALRDSLGDQLFSNRYDHEREHSIELHIPWIQHVFGKDESGEFPRVFGALVHDPAVANGAAYDGNGVALEPFVAALKRCIADMPGKTLVVSSADLSHAGPAFGDPKPLLGDDAETKAARDKIVQHDIAMLDLVSKNKPSELIAAMAWQQNPTRWCSTGTLVATLLTVEPTQVQILNYAATLDQQGMTMVSSAAMVMR